MCFLKIQYAVLLLEDKRDVGERVWWKSWERVRRKSILIAIPVRVIHAYFYKKRNPSYMYIYFCKDNSSSRMFTLALFFLVKLAFFLGGGFLILLVFGNQIVHIALSFGEFHFIHTLSCIPMQESFPPEHRRKLFRYSFEQFLNSHLQNKMKNRRFVMIIVVSFVW